MNTECPEILVNPQPTVFEKLIQKVICIFLFQAVFLRYV